MQRVGRRRRKSHLRPRNQYTSDVEPYVGKLHQVTVGRICRYLLSPRGQVRLTYADVFSRRQTRFGTAALGGTARPSRRAN